MLIDDAAVLVDDLNRDDALGGRQRHGEAGLHILCDPRGRAANWNKLLGRAHVDGRSGLASRPITGSCVVFENALPALVDGAVVVQILLIKLVFQPTIDIGHTGGFFSMIPREACPTAQPATHSAGRHGIERALALLQGLTHRQEGNSLLSLRTGHWGVYIDQRRFDLRLLR